MKFRIYIILSLLIFAVSAVISLQAQTKQVSPPNPALMGCCFEESSAGLFDRPVNTGEKDADEMAKPVYHQAGGYKTMQMGAHKFKDHAPFIEIDRNNQKKERLWFSSSRFPINPLLAEKTTDKIMQIYFIDRVLIDEECPNRGWGNNLNILVTGKSEFDRAAKGAVTIANGKMIVSANYVEGNYSHEFNNLWELEASNNYNMPYINPVSIDELSNDSTWESHPSLSPDGNHLFFVSNRKVNDYSTYDDYENNEWGKDKNIFYAYRTETGWSKPVLVKEISKSGSHQETPHVSWDGKTLYYASNENGNFDIFAIEMNLEDGAYSFSGKAKKAEYYDACRNRLYDINTGSDERYPFLYHNPANGMSDGILWSSNKSSGWGNYDIYGCSFYKILELYVFDCNGNKITDPVDISIDDKNFTELISKRCDEYKRYRIYKNKRYTVTGTISKKYDRYDPASKQICNYWTPAAFTKVSLGGELNTLDTSYVLETIESLNYKVKLGKEYKKEYVGTVNIGGKDIEAKIKEEGKIIGSELSQDGENLVVKRKVTQHLEWEDYYYTASPGHCGDYCGTEEEIATSIKTMNGEVLIDDDFIGNTIRDTLYFTPCCEDDPREILLTVDLIDICPECAARGEAAKVIDPVIKLVEVVNGRENLVTEVNADKLEYKLEPDKDYRVYGGSKFCDQYDCAICDSYIFKGYQKVLNNQVKGVDDNETKFCGKASDLCGAGHKSYLTAGSGITTKGLMANTEQTKFEFRDRIFITKVLHEKPPCQCAFVNLTGIDKKVPYFQTAFWEVNTSKNLGSVIDLDKLKFTPGSHLDRLTKGFSISSSSGQETFDRSVTDFDVTRMGTRWGWLEPALFPKTSTDNGGYTIANGRWIELHPNNQYWGVRENMDARMKDLRVNSYKQRVREYENFAAQVDKNLDVMAEIITKKGIPIFKKLKEVSGDNETKLIIEIIAISDEREVTRGWYIGDNPVQYNAGEISNNRFNQRLVDIKPPNVDLANRKVVVADPATNLGTGNKTLSDLRAWYGYKEIYNRIKDDPLFREYLNNNKVFLPDTDCKTSFEDCQIAVMTCGLGRSAYYQKMINMPGYKEDGAWNIYERKSYPNINDPHGSGYYDYDTVRSLATRISIINYDNGIIEPSQCCDGSKSDCGKMINSDFAGKAINIDLNDDADESLRKLEAIDNPKGIFLTIKSDKIKTETLMDMLKETGLKDMFIRQNAFADNKSYIFVKYSSTKEANAAKARLMEQINASDKMKNLGIMMKVENYK